MRDNKKNLSKDKEIIHILQHNSEMNTTQLFWTYEVLFYDLSLEIIKYEKRE